MSAQLCVLDGRAAGPIDLPASRTGIQEGRWQEHPQKAEASFKGSHIDFGERERGGGSALPALVLFSFTLPRVADTPGQRGTRSPWL